jgi:hypothetical protein
MDKKPIAEFLLGGPGHDGYAFRAALYCVDCGQIIIRELYADNYPALLVQDTDSSPQPVFFGESTDCAQHCGNCQTYLYGSKVSQ